MVIFKVKNYLLFEKILGDKMTPVVVFKHLYLEIVISSVSAPVILILMVALLLDE